MVNKQYSRMIRSMVLNWDKFSPRRDVTMSGDIFIS